MLNERMEAVRTTVQSMIPKVFPEDYLGYVLNDKITIEDLCVQIMMMLNAGQKILKHNAPEYTTLPATKDDWTALDMPDERDHFILKRHFTDAKPLRVAKPVRDILGVWL